MKLKKPTKTEWFFEKNGSTDFEARRTSGGVRRGGGGEGQSGKEWRGCGWRGEGVDRKRGLCATDERARGGHAHTARPSAYCLLHPKSGPNLGRGWVESG